MRTIWRYACEEDFLSPAISLLVLITLATVDVHKLIQLATPKGISDCLI